MSPALRIGATGFGLIAVCYGFARFAFGLFLPQIDADLHLGPTLSGVISGGSFLGYCIAIIASAIMTERVGARAVGTAAGVVAAVGMAGIALAPSATWLAVSVLVAGSSTGLASPPMAAAVAAAVRQKQQDTTNTAINAGTGAGVALCGPIALAMTGQWRLAFATFAATAALLAVTAAFALPTATGGTPPGSRPRLSRALLRLIAASVLMGVASTAIWSFGSQLVSQRLGWGATGTGLLWSLIGAGGIAGVGTGGLVARFGLSHVHRIFLVLLALAILMVGAGSATPVMVLVGGAIFGAAYVILSGVYLIWGLRAVPDRPATGLTIGFVSLAIGQTAGAPAFGLLLGALGANAAVVIFATVSVVTSLLHTPAKRPQVTA
ncbi:YbfB/YjiJ family MFS transporter [Rhodobacteraceae bacterium]|nr:YbfB/YjiJ family MFS transporter [Paracoccaceae bacterium]